MGLRDLMENIQYGLEEAKDRLEELKDDALYTTEDFVDEKKDVIQYLAYGLKERIVGGEFPIRHAPFPIAGGNFNSLLSGAQSEIVGSFFKKKVAPERGCILICKIAGGLAEHSGVYVGDGEVVELKGNGQIRKVSFHEFLHDGLTRTGAHIYIACDSSNTVLHDTSIARRANDMVGHARDYNVIMDNCHQFTSGCITGDFENVDNFFLFLAQSIKKEMNHGGTIRWLICDKMRVA